MNPKFDVPSFFTACRKEVSRILVHLANPASSDPIISSSVRLAQQKRAHLRGMTIIDTTRLMRDLAIEGSAAFAAFESEHLASCENIREEVRSNFSISCLAASLDFDLCRRQGDVTAIIEMESRFHDLLITSALTEKPKTIDDIGAAHIAKIVRASHCPTLILRDQPTSLERVLLVHDGSKACSRAMSSFRRQRLLPEATVRLIAVGNTQECAKKLLSEQIDLLQVHPQAFEYGYLVGKAARLIPEYVQNWDADLVVYGINQKGSIIDNLFTQPGLEVLRRTTASLYSA